jgi:hypothetical protein
MFMNRFRTANLIFPPPLEAVVNFLRFVTSTTIVSSDRMIAIAKAMLASVAIRAVP